MNIHFVKCEYGISYGGGFNKPFRYLGRILAERFQAEHIEFSFQEIEIQLTSLPQETQDEKSISWYNKLPIYYRGKNMVRVILPVTEIQENVSDIFQWIYKAFDIIAAKKKKGDLFATEKTKEILNKLETELNATDLFELNDTYERIERQKTIERNIQERTKREQIADRKMRLIYDLRFYYRLPGAEKLYFRPYDDRFLNIIYDKLRHRKFRLPNYTHLYIMVADTYDNALFHAVRAENWFAYGIAVFEHYAEYTTLNETEKHRTVFDLIKQGLNDAATVDKLDRETLNAVLDEVEQKFFGKPSVQHKQSNGTA